MQLFFTFFLIFVTTNAPECVIIVNTDNNSITKVLENMNKNIDINTLVSKLLTGEISEEEGKELLSRVEQDASLKDKIEHLMNEEDFLQRYHLYKSIDAEKAKATFKASLQHAEEQEDRNDDKAATIIWLRRIAAAAAIALILMGTWMYFGHQGSTPPAVITAELHQAIERVQQNDMNGATLTINGKTIKVKDAQSALAQAEKVADSKDGSSFFGSDEITESSLITKKDKEFWMVLDDGTYVHLNYNTTLIYPNHFVGSERKVKLKGEAYFIVANDSKKRPFIVETANGDVHDYGTEFNVNTMKEKGVTSVVLVKGKVGVSSKYGKEYLLKPGDMATLKAGRTPDIQQVDVNLYTSWNTGNFLFDGCTLQDLMEVISHWYNMKVEFSSEDMKELRFTGSIDKYEPMGQTLNAIENITRLKITAKEGIINIREYKH